MMRSSRGMLWLAIALMTVSGCKKKNKTVPAAAQAPTITAPAPAPPPVVAKAPTAATEKKPATEASKQKPRPKPKPVAKKPASKPPASESARPVAETTIAKATVPRIVVQPSPTGVVPDMSHTEEAHHRQTTEQLMLSTETNLKSLKRVLNADERALLQQVQLFMKQARDASQAQDLVRAHNLALKAHLLSDELVR